MRIKSLGLTVALLILVLSLTYAQKKDDKVQLGQSSEPTLKVDHSKADTLWFEFKQNGNKLVADLMLFSDQPIAGGQIPLKFGNGKSPLAVDSVKFDSKRAGKFDVTNDGIDAATQTLRIGFIADISGRKPPLVAGRGKLLSIYFNLKIDKPYEVVVDTATLDGGYSLLFADQAAQNVPVAFKTGKFKTK